MATNNGKSLDAKLHMSSVYSRKKKKPKRKFCLIIGGLLITSSLLGCTDLNVVAAPEAVKPTSVVSYEDQVINDVVKVDETQQMIKKLELLAKVIEDNGLNMKALINLHSSLSQLEKSINDSDFNTSVLSDSKDSLVNALLRAERALVMKKK